MKAAAATPVIEEGLSVLFPVTQEYTGEVYSLGGTLATPFTHTVKVDQSTEEMRISTIGTDFEYQGRLEPCLQMKESDFIFKNKKMIQFLGHDRRITRFDPGRKVLIIRYFLNDREKGTKEFSPDGKWVDSDVLLVFLQGMLLKKTGDFTLTLIQKAKGLRVNADFKLVTIDNPLSISTGYDFPEGFQNSFKQINKVHVYVMELTGLPGLVYAYKYYFAYRKEPPFQLLAYWGGAPKEAEFGFLK